MYLFSCVVSTLLYPALEITLISRSNLLCLFSTLLIPSLSHALLPKATKFWWETLILSPLQHDTTTNSAAHGITAPPCQQSRLKSFLLLLMNQQPNSKILYVTFMLSRAFRHEALLTGDQHTEINTLCKYCRTGRALCLSRLKLACRDDPPGMLNQHTQGNNGRWAGKLAKVTLKVTSYHLWRRFQTRRLNSH